MSLTDRSNGGDGDLQSLARKRARHGRPSEATSQALLSDFPTLSQLLQKLSISVLANGAVCPSVPRALASAERAFADLDQAGLINDFRLAVERLHLLQHFLRPIQEVVAEPSVRLGGDGGTASVFAAPSVSTSHNSVAKILLSISSVQRGLADVLIEHIPSVQYANKPMPEAGAPETRGSGAPKCDTAAVNFPKMILSQFRWIDFPMQLEHIAGKLLEILDACDSDVKRDVISLLPEVVPDSAKSGVVAKLLSTMADDSSMTAAVLEALGNICLDAEQTASIVETVRGFLSAAQPADLPVVLRYLIQACDGENIVLTVSSIRHGISCGSSNLRDLAVEPMVLETIHSGLQFRDDVAREFIACISKAPLGSPQVLDLWVLYGLYSLSHYKARVKKIILSRFARGGFTNDTLRQSICSHTKALAVHFPALVSIAGALCEAPKAACQQAGGVLYRLLFTEFDGENKAFYRTEVVGALMTHLGASISSEKEAALEVLASLASDPATVAELRPFLPFIKGIIDFVEKFDDKCVRKVFFVLCTLIASPATPTGGSSGKAAPSSQASSATSDSSIERDRSFDEFHILVQKHLAHESLELKRVGILAVISAMQHKASLIVPSARDDDENIRDLENSLDGYTRMVVRHCKTHHSTISFFYDELFRFICSTQLPKSVFQWFSERLSSHFEETFLVDFIASDDPAVGSGVLVFDGSLQTQDLFTLDGAETSVSLNLLPLVAESNRVKRHAPFWLPALFRCLGACETILQKGHLGEIDACIGCPVRLFPAGVLNDFAGRPLAVQQRICFAIFHAVNWMRQQVNVFAGDPSSEMRIKVCRRFKHIVKLEQKLALCAKDCPAFLAALEGLASSSACGGSQGKAKRLARVKPTKKKARNTRGDSKAKRARRSKATDDTDDGDGAVDDAAGSTADHAEAGDSAESMPRLASLNEAAVTARLEQYYYPLQLNVMEMLSWGKMDGDVIDAASQTAAVKTYEVSSSSRALLLRDLRSKLQYYERNGRGGRGATSVSAQQSSLPVVVQGIYRLLPAASPHAVVDYLLYTISNATTRSRIEELASLLASPEALTPKQQADTEMSVEAYLDCLTIFFHRLESLDPATALVSEGNDDDDDDDSDSDESQDADSEDTSSFETDILKLFTLPQFMGRSGSSKRLCLAALKPFCKVEPSREASLSEIVSLVFAYFRDLCHASLIGASYNLALKALDLMHALAGVSRSQFVMKQDVIGGAASQGVRPLDTTGLANLARSILETDWAENQDKMFRYATKTFSKVVDTCIEFSAKSIVTIETFADSIEIMIGLQDGTNSPAAKQASDALLTLTPKTFHIYFSSLMKGVVNCFAALRFNDSDEVTDTVAEAKRVVLCFTKLATLSRVVEHNRAIVVAILVHGKKFMQLFIAKLGFFQEHFPAAQHEILSLLKQLQKSTRQMQALCAHGKVARDMTMAGKVPVMKRILEEFILRVKALLQAHNCAGAFRVGNLKHRLVTGSSVENPCLAPTQHEQADADADPEAEEVESHETEAGATPRRPGGRPHSEADETDEEEEDDAH
eukprot:INCI9329.1.p1 GENE.INCI9329.1~~INCI9329.1.p1  ORF type:complete len:1550 (-),score=319.15 INCI9329.1:151-4800(-)